MGKGDGRYIASNGKDQLLKVWDLRRMLSNENIRDIPAGTKFDYTMEMYPLWDNQKKLREDTSLFTFRGHHIYNTLIKCQFSPRETTGQRYISTGSADGSVYIFDTLTGGTAMHLRSDLQKDTVKEVSWHPSKPIIATSSFKGALNLWSINTGQTPEMVYEMPAEQYMGDRNDNVQRSVRPNREAMGLHLGFQEMGQVVDQ